MNGGFSNTMISGGYQSARPDLTRLCALITSKSNLKKLQVI